MGCQTIRKDMECGFMSKRGCGYPGGACKPVVEQCKPCRRKFEIESGIYCRSFPDPEAKWKNGRCNFATHLRRKIVKEEKINPLKASRRGLRQKAKEK